LEDSMRFTFPEQQKCVVRASNLNTCINRELKEQVEVLAAFLNVTSPEHFPIALLFEIQNAYLYFSMADAGCKITETTLLHQRNTSVYREGNVFVCFYKPMYTTGAIYPSIKLHKDLYIL
jgi:hypothetical protein